MLVHAGASFPSNRIKDQLLLSYLVRAVPDDELIFFTDGNDAVMLAGEEEIVAKFESMGKELVFSAEAGCWPDSSLASEYPPSNSPFRFLNSGGFVGRCGVIKNLLAVNPVAGDRFPESNQYVWTKRFFDNQHLVGLDTACEIFHTFSPPFGEDAPASGIERNTVAYYHNLKQWFAKNFMVEQGRLYSCLAGTRPAQAHFNGASKWLMDVDLIDMVFSKVASSRQTAFIYEHDRSSQSG